MTGNRETKDGKQRNKGRETEEQRTGNRGTKDGKQRNNGRETEEQRTVNRGTMDRNSGIEPHCKDKIPKFRNKYSQKRNIGVSVPISKFMRL
jgi:hypothetical protein